MIFVFKNTQWPKNTDVNLRRFAVEATTENNETKPTVAQVTRRGIAEVIEGPNLPAIRSRLLDYLEQKRILFYSEEHDKWLADLDQLKQLDFRVLDETGIFSDSGRKNVLTVLSKQINSTEQTRYSAIFALLKDFKASPTLKPQSEERPLLFSPSPEALYKPDTYKKPNALLSIEDLHDSKRSIQTNTFRYPELSLEESRQSWILNYIYHPDHGNGQRNETGALMVDYRDKEGRVIKRAPITSKWLNENHLSRLQLNEDILSTNPAPILKQHGKALADYGGLKPSDFRQTKLASENNAIHRGISGGYGGEVSLNGVSYKFGSIFQNGDSIQISDKLAILRNRIGDWFVFEPLSSGEVQAYKKDQGIQKGVPHLSWSSDDISLKKRLHKIKIDKLPDGLDHSHIIEYLRDLLSERDKRQSVRDILGLQKMLDTTFEAPTRRSGTSEKLRAFNAFLEKYKARRLRLDTPEERIPLALADERVDDEDGFLCVYVENERCYRKISLDFIRANFFELDTSALKSFYDDSDIDLKASDIGILDFVPRKLGKSNSTPVINGIRYCFPTNEFKIKTTGERVKINPATDRFLKLSEKYAVLILNRPSGTRAYQLQLSSKEQLSDDPIHRKRLDKYKMTYLSAEATAEQLDEWDVTPLVPPHANEQPQDYARRVMRCSDINRFLGIYRELIDGAQFNLQAYDLKKQLLFASYYANLTPEAKQDVQHLLREQGEAFFNAFQACEFGLGMGDLVVQIARKHAEAAMPIFNQFEALMKVADQKEQIQESEAFDETRFYTVVVKRGAELLKAVAGKKAGENLDEFVKKARQYHADVVGFGAQMAAIASTTKTIPTSPEAINEALSDVRVDEIEAGGMVKKGSWLAMQSHKNYLQPDRFNEKDYKMIVENLEQAYGQIDPGWLQHLIDNIPNDLNNPKVTFLLVKNKKGELVGVIKRKKVSEKEYYFGTMYVEKEYQKGFGIGQYLDSYMKQGLPDDAKMEGTVAASNPAAARHIDAVGYVGSHITTEGEGTKKSGALINLDLNPRYSFKTKNRKAFSEGNIKALHAEGKVPEGLKILVRDTSGANAEPYTRELDDLFKQGYFLTRFFYADGRSQERTYLVLERPLSGQTKIETSKTIKEAA